MRLSQRAYARWIIHRQRTTDDWSCENQQLALNSFHLYAVVEPLQSGPWRKNRSANIWAAANVTIAHRRLITGHLSESQIICISLRVGGSLRLGKRKFVHRIEIIREAQGNFGVHSDARHLGGNSRQHQQPNENDVQAEDYYRLTFNFALCSFASWQFQQIGRQRDRCLRMSSFWHRYVFAWSFCSSLPFSRLAHGYRSRCSYFSTVKWNS